jgi:DNA modification methylase
MTTEALTSDPTPLARAGYSSQLQSQLRLDEVDWDFPQRKSAAIEAIHPYPAKFIAEIPRTLLEILPLEQDTFVFDPFCGSGTTLVEAQARGLSSVGIDLNPIACLLTRVKTTPIPDDIETVVHNVVDQARLAPSAIIPAIPNLDHWFKKPVQIALASLIQSIGGAPCLYHDLLRLAVSSIIVRVSNQESDTRYAAVEKKSTADNVFNGFIEAVGRISKALKQRNYRLAETKVIQSNTLTTEPDKIGQRIGIVITSPPYPNAYEYWLYHKYRMWWLGYDPLLVKENEIGARAHFFKRNHHTATNFVDQMRSTLKLIEAVSTPNAYACFVIGRSKIHGKVVDNVRIINEVGRAHGFQPIFKRDRTIYENRKSFNLSHANIKQETVLILKRS